VILNTECSARVCVCVCVCVCLLLFPIHTTVPANIRFAHEEEKVLKFWIETKAFQTSLKLSKGKKRYTFYDGPPFATGLPHYGHILAGTIKVCVCVCRLKKINLQYIYIYILLLLLLLPLLLFATLCSHTHDREKIELMCTYVCICMMYRMLLQDMHIKQGIM